MLQNIPTPTLVAVATGVVGATWSSGMIASLSIIGCPAALGLSQSQAAWAGLYDHGVAIMPKVAGIVAAAYLQASYAPRSGKVARKHRTGYLAAALLAVAIVPYTIALMRPTNNKLLAVKESMNAVNTLSQGEVARLINGWSALNLGRSVLPLISGIVGAATFIDTLQ